MDSISIILGIVLLVSVALNLWQLFESHSESLDTYISAQTAAERYHVSDDTMRKLAKRGEVQYIMVGKQYRYSTRGLDRFFNSEAARRCVKTISKPTVTPNN